MLLCLNAVTRRGIAAWHFQKKTPEALQAAIRWDPRNAQYYDALATMRHFYADTDNPDEQVKLYQRAVNLPEPSKRFVLGRPRHCLRLGRKPQ